MSYEIFCCVILLILNSVILDSDVISSSCQHIYSEVLNISITCLSVGLSAFDGVPLGDYSKCQT